ncbi:holo-ACP synthase [Gammaproteobacteria bacterium]|jgi:holo-[acyl-carrier protein] synthase|nr:holo-ACP synthase [Gammaproteobacteria bacterium]
MIYGIGIDIVNISRIKKMDSLKSFSEKILSANELKISASYDVNNFISYLAKQFACKEALSKAFGTGIRKPILFKELEILRDEKGKPYFNPLGDVKKTIINLGITKTHVSLADESEHAIAFAILEI